MEEKRKEDEKAEIEFVEAVAKMYLIFTAK